MCTIPKPYPREFREDVVRVARGRKSGTLLADIATDFGISETCLANWMKAADVEDGLKPGTTAADTLSCVRRESGSAYWSRGTRVCAMLRPACLRRTCRERFFPLVRELADDDIPVTVSFRVLELCRQQHYRWLSDPITDSERDNAHRSNAILAAHDDDPQYGYRFLVDEVRAAGFDVAERTVWKICSTNRWWSSFGKKRGRNGKKAGPPVHDDRLNRVFLEGRANQIWLTDISEHPTSEGKVYLCAIKDTWSNRIAGYSIDERITAELAVRARENAVARRGGVAGCIVHSGRGSQSRSRRSSRHSSVIAWWDRWAGSEQPATTRRWNRSSPCCRRTSSTPADGTPETSCGSRS